MSDDESVSSGPAFVPDFLEDGEKRPTPTYALIRHVDLPDESRGDIVDMIVGTVERFMGEPETACRHIKETLDRVYNPGWHAVIGEQYGFEISYDYQHFVYIFFNGNTGILVWKCSA